MFLYYYVRIYHIFYDVCTTLNAQFAEFHLCAPVVLNIVMEKSFKKYWGTFCGLIVRWPILLYKATIISTSVVLTQPQFPHSI